MNNLEKNIWDNHDIEMFYEYLLSQKKENKIDQTKRVVNTKMDVLAIPFSCLKSIAKQIYKGNYISFLDLMPHKYFDSLIIVAYIISMIKDYKFQKKYINKLSKYIDSWAVVDALKYNIKSYENEYLEYAKKLIVDSKPFKRRIGVRILFSYINTNYIDELMEIIKVLNKEEDYYVNMAIAWFLCEAFIYHKEEVLNYLKNNRENKFVINKTISKCRDSFRVSKDDKNLLLKYKID